MNISRRDLFKCAGLAAGAGMFVPGPIIAQRALPKSEYDYVDWSWERWRSITKVVRPRIDKSEQAGKGELVDLLGLVPNRIISASEWQRKRAEIRRRLGVFLGIGPSAKPPLEVKNLGETRRDDHMVRKLAFQTERGEFVPSLLLIPNGVKWAPLVICPHQTTQTGKNEPAGFSGKPELQTALHLVKRGFVTFTYDAPCFGERHDPASGHYGDAIPFYRKHPRWSLLGKMIWDLQRAIDYLETLDFVDTSRIASIGHSHGGYTSLFAMAFDERIKAGVSNCGFDTFRIDGNTWRWSHATALLPRLGFYVSNPRINMDLYRAVPDSAVIDVPFDMHEMLALIAPRPLLLSTSDEDFVFPNGGWSARQAVAKVRPVYDLLREGNGLETFFFNGGHNFPQQASENAYKWLETKLKHQ